MREEPTERRDFLALERTLLANERTFLAYVRTALALLVTGVAAIRFFLSPAASALGIAAILLSAFVAIVGVWRFVAVRRSLREPESDQDPRLKE